jgi:pimeloyl-ACP methyl ester carboxylesterase
MCIDESWHPSPWLVLHVVVERLVELVAGSKLVVAEDAGHVPTVTRPNWVASEINAFFATPA